MTSGKDCSLKISRDRSMCAWMAVRILHVTAKFKQMAPAVANAIDFRLLPGVTLIGCLYDNKLLIILLLSKLRLLLDLFI